MKISDEAFDLAKSWADSNDSDVIVYNGPINIKDTEEFIKECRQRDFTRTNALLLLTTNGGSADAAYRLGRWLQLAYGKGTVRIWVTGCCKSAGTLLAIAGNALIIGDGGELGPLDVQLSKTDELFEWNSGLIIDSALTSLEQRAINMFENYFIRIMTRSAGRVTFKTATTISANMVTSLLGPVYSQIDPIKIGENAREMSVASDYGKRLNEHSNNLRSRSALKTLVQSYCSHGFVIDRKEASGLFNRVDAPDATLRKLEAALGEIALWPGEEPTFGYLSDTADEEVENENNTEAQPADTAASDKIDAAVIRANFGGAVEKDDTAASIEPGRHRDSH